jgi:hypothetical protein
MRSLFQKSGVMFIALFLKKPGWPAAENTAARQASAVDVCA